MLIPINLANVPVATGFDYPPGKYIFKVTGVKIMANTDGAGQRLVVSNEIVMGPGPSEQFKGRPLSNSYQLSDKGAPFLKRLFVASGIDEAYIAGNGGNMDAEWLVGRQYMATVIKRDQYSNITNEAHVSEWGGGGGQQTATAAPAPAAQPSMLQPSAAPPMMGAAPPPPSGMVPPQGFVAPPPPPGKIG